ncbi:MAG: hypothetical protein ACJ8FZ_03115, partial [Bradyrhizobium sp.]
ALAPFIAAPTQRVALLMAEIERTEHGDSARARTWTLRAVRALHDPAWTADGYVSDRWRPVSPVTGRLDAFQWQTPVAALPSDKGAAIESSPFEEAILAASAPRHGAIAKDNVTENANENQVEPPQDAPGEPAAKPVEPVPRAAQDNAPPPAAVVEPAAEPASPTAPAPSSPPAESAPAAAPLFRARQDIPKAAPSPIPAVIPLIRAPDDPGIDEEGERDEFAEQIAPPEGQVGGWRGFLSRWGS